MDVDIKISGFTQLNDMMKNLPGNVQQRIMSSAIVAAAGEARDLLRAATSQDSERWGRVSKAIVSKKRKAPRGMARAAVVIRTKGKRSAPHWHLIEYGTEPRYRKTLGEKKSTGGKKHRKRKQKTASMGERRGYTGEMPSSLGVLRKAWDAGHESVIRAHTKKTMARIVLEGLRLFKAGKVA